MKSLILSVLLMVVSLLSPKAQSASMTGYESNSSDAVEAFFIKTGSALLARLSQTSEGQKFLTELPVSLAALTATLDHSRITVSEEPLYDITFAEVDAKVEQRVIFLYSKNWLEHMKSNTRTHVLVFHEMLRSAGVNDDNYRYSKGIDVFLNATDPRETLNLSRYINPGEIQIQVTDGNQTTSIAPFVFVNNLESKLAISSADLQKKNSIRKNQDNTYALSIPVNSTGKTKMLVYRVDYEYVGHLKTGALLHSKREVRFQSVSTPETIDQYFSTSAGNTATVTDLIHIESAYKESLQIRISNHIVSQGSDHVSNMVLNRVVVYFNILIL